MFGEILILLAAIGGSGWVVGMFAWLWHRVRVLEMATAGVRATDAAQLRAELASLGGELSGNHEELEKLHERVDFLERLLEKGQDGQLPTSRASSSEEAK